MQLKHSGLPEKIKDISALNQGIGKDFCNRLVF